MNLTWHIVRKDLRRLAGPWAGWMVATVAVQWWLFGQSPSPEAAASFRQARWAAQMAIYAEWLALLQALVTALLTAFLIQEDSLCGTTASWMTRPITPLRLLRAKLATGGPLLVVAPVLASLPFWIAADFSGREIGWAAAECAAAQGIVVAAALAIAAITTDLGLFLLTLLAAVVGAGAASMGPAWFTRNLMRNPAALEMAWVVAMVGVPLAAAAVVAVQLRWRNPGGARAALLGSVAILVLACRIGGEAGAAVDRLPDWWRNVSGKDGGRRLESVTFELGRSRDSAAAVELSANVTRGARDGHWIVPIGEGWVTFPDSGVGAESAPVSREASWGSDWGRRLALGDGAVEGARWTVRWWGTASRWDALWQEKSPRPGGFLRWGTVRAVNVGEAPWRSGAEAKSGSSRWRIAGIPAYPDGGNRTAVVVEHDAWISVDSGRFDGVPSKEKDLRRHDLYFLVEAERRHAVQLQPRSVNAWRNLTLASSVRVLELPVRDFDAWPVKAGIKPAERLGNARLVRVRLEIEDRFSYPMVGAAVRLAEGAN